MVSRTGVPDKLPPALLGRLSIVQWMARAAAAGPSQYSAVDGRRCCRLSIVQWMAAAARTAVVCWYSLCAGMAITEAGSPCQCQGMSTQRGMDRGSC